MRPSRRPAAAALLCAAAVLAGCATTERSATAKGDVTPKPDDAVVELVGLTFNPRTITVPVGRRVRWQWTDLVVHNVVSTDFVSSKAQGGGAFAVTFDRAGTFAYRCTLHTGMDGTVIVAP